MREPYPDTDTHLESGREAEREKDAHTDTSKTEKKWEKERKERKKCLLARTRDERMSLVLFLVNIFFCFRVFVITVVAGTGGGGGGAAAAALAHSLYRSKYMLHDKLKVRLLAR